MKRCPKCGEEYGDTNTLCPADGAVLEKDKDTLIGQLLAGKYRIEEFLNEGGMGAVYRGTHVLMDKIVAIKVLNPALAADDKIVARFSREARAASRLSHPHALNVTDFGESEDGTVFLVMEYLRGETLKDLIRREGPLPLPRVVEIVRQVSGALEAAHAESVVHRDLKSDNIMLVDVGEGDWVKVLDFGIAKIQETSGQDPELTAPNLIIGTPQYMSPEQCSQTSEIDRRSDIYSFGVILYEMLVGHVPFTGESPTAVMLRHIQEPAPSVLDERKDLPPRVAEVVNRALAKRREDRFQTATELSQGLAEAAEGAPLTTALTSENSADRETNRIVVPTGQNEPSRATDETELDEETVVRARAGQTTPMERDELYPSPPPPPAPDNGTNSWRIAALALAGVLVLGGVLYALTRSGQNTEPQTNNPLTADPNAQPVQSAQPPTGQGEQGIAPNAPVVPTTGNTNTGAGTNVNQNTSPPTGADNANANDNTQANDNTNEDEGTEPETPPANSNQGNEPTPKKTPPAANPDEDEPPPLPTPKPKTPPKELPKAQPSGDSSAPPATDNEENQ